MDQVVAVLDDDHMTCMMLEYVLETDGIACQCFADPAEFLDYIRGHRPICVLLGMNMPEIAGLEVLFTLAEMGCESPVIVVSAEYDMTTARTLLNCGASNVIAKPIDPERVLQGIREATAPRADIAA